MKIRPITGVGTSGYEFKTNLVEMETLASLNERAAEVCESFKTKPSYFTKEECQLIHAVLSTFVADYKRESENSFLNKLKEQTEEKEEEKPQTPAGECPEVLIKGGPSPEAELPLEMTILE